MLDKHSNKQAKAGRGIINEKMKQVQWKKGQSGNPNGRAKKGLCIPDILNRIGKEPAGIDKLTKLEAVLCLVYKKALEGDNWCVEYISSRTEGKALERVENTIIEEAAEKIIEELNTEKLE